MVLVGLSLAATRGRAAAAIDLSGEYVVTVTVTVPIPIPCRVTTVQTGTSFQTTGSCDFNATPTPFSASGTVDPVTGAFSGPFDLGGVCSGIISGTGDGEVLIGTITAPCYSGPFSASKCGNGVIDPLENCEDGNQADGDCCSARCRLDAAGTACTGDRDECTDDVCNATGTCTHVPVPRPCAPATGGCRRTATTAEDRATCTRATCAGRAGKARRACVRACQPAPIRTLAYAVTRCREDPRGVITRHQEVRIRRGDCPPVTVFSIDPPNLPDPYGSTCLDFGMARAGNYTMVLVGLISRIDVSRDGSVVVFEVTDDFSFLNRQAVPPEREGIYLVRADGSGLRRLGPASRDSPFRGGFPATVDPHLPFSPDGRRIVFTDRGAGPGGDAVQIVTLELESGRRTQLTHLPPVVPPSPWQRDSGFARFTDNDTVLFGTYADADGAHPGSEAFNFFSVKTDGTGLRAVAAPVVLPGSRVQQAFQIAGGGGNLVTLRLPGMPANPLAGLDSIFEVFLIDGKNLLQLTAFGRRDTGGELLSVDRRRVFFRASADPLGTNPAENCQLFSVDRFGGHMRQITHFGPSEGAHSAGGCGTAGPFPPGCDLATFIQDPVTRTLVFISSCDPLGRNPYGGQLFAMRPDGSGLRQLTDSHGLVIEADGTVDAEVSGPFWYSGRRDEATTSPR